jgi:hypothetical protein
MQSSALVLVTYIGVYGLIPRENGHVLARATALARAKEEDWYCLVGVLFRLSLGPRVSRSLFLSLPLCLGASRSGVSIGLSVLVPHGRCSCLCLSFLVPPGWCVLLFLRIDASRSVFLSLPPVCPSSNSSSR